MRRASGGGRLADRSRLAGPEASRRFAPCNPAYVQPQNDGVFTWELPCSPSPRSHTPCKPWFTGFIQSIVHACNATASTLHLSQRATRNGPPPAHQQPGGHCKSHETLSTQIGQRLPCPGKRDWKPQTTLVSNTAQGKHLATPLTIAGPPPCACCGTRPSRQIPLAW